MTEIYCKAVCEDHQAEESAVKFLFQKQNSSSRLSTEKMSIKFSINHSALNHSTMLLTNVKQKRRIFFVFHFFPNFFCF